MAWDGKGHTIGSVNVSSVGSVYDLFIDLSNGSVQNIDTVTLYATSITNGDANLSFYRATNDSGMTGTTNILKGSTYVADDVSIKFNDGFITEQDKLGIKILSNTASIFKFNIEYYYK